MTTISLCMVVRNSEKTLPKIFKKLNGVVDEICICDQSSDDNTEKVCDEFGVDLFYSVTRKNLADVDRQDLYNFASKDMILALDDDELPNERLIKFLKEVKRTEPSHDIYWFGFENLVDGVNIDDILTPMDVVLKDPHPRFWVNKQPPVIVWPQVAHTFPEFNTNSHLFCTRGKVIHNRTLAKIRRVTEDRGKVIDPRNQQVEQNFLRAVEEKLRLKGKIK